MLSGVNSYMSKLLFIFRRMWSVIRFSGVPIRVGRNPWIARKSILRIVGGGSISIGENCEIHPFSMILTYGGDIKIGNNFSLNPFSIVYGHGGVQIGDDVRIAAHTVIIPANHNVSIDGQPLHASGVSAKGIVISDHVWIGTGARILDGVHIGNNTVVAAGAVVTKSVPDYSTVAGVPARVIRGK